MNHEEKVRKYYPAYNSVGENFKPKREWPKGQVVKRKREFFSTSLLVFGFCCLGFAAALIFAGISLKNDLVPGYTKSENLNISYQQGVLDAASAIMNYTKATGITYIQHQGNLVELRCFLPEPQNLNNITGGK